MRGNAKLEIDQSGGCHGNWVRKDGAEGGGGECVKAASVAKAQR